jgi:hypothetical protein
MPGPRRLAIAHRHKKPTKSRPLAMTGAGDSKILVKDHHVLEPKLPSSILKRVLAATTLLITRDLAQGRLADINMSGSFKCFAVMLSLIGACVLGFCFENDRLEQLLRTALHRRTRHIELRHR